MGEQRCLLLGLSVSEVNLHSRLRFPKSPAITKIYAPFLPYGGDDLQKRAKELYGKAKKAIYYGLRARFIKRTTFASRLGRRFAATRPTTGNGCNRLCLDLNLIRAFLKFILRFLS